MSVMMNENVAYTEEYQKYRRTFDWVYRSDISEEDSLILDRGRYLVSWKRYSAQQNTDHAIPRIFRCVKVAVEDQEGNLIYEFKCNNDIFSIEHIWHQNGHELLLFNIDIYGCSVFDLTTKQQVHYIPPQLLSGEPFYYWEKVMYCPINNLLVAEGGSWGQPYMNYFYDFSEPMKFPLKAYTDSVTLGQQLGVSEVVFSDFTDEGACIIDAVSTEGQRLQIEVDVTEQ